MRIKFILAAIFIIAISTQADAFTITGPGPLIKPAQAGTPKYARQLEIRDASGTITMFVTAAGSMILGTPAPLSISEVIPANGATGVLAGTIPSVKLNQGVEGVSISNIYIVGSLIAPSQDSSLDNVHHGEWYFPGFAGTPGTTYTIKVVRSAITSTQGETASNCGTAMTDIAGVCTSTFTMAP